MSEKPVNEGGRPPRYDQEDLSILAKSLKQWTNDHANKNKFQLLKRWCFDNDFPPRHFKRYCEKSEEFKEAYEWAKEWQEYSAAYGAFTQTLNARFAQFYLGCHHNWKTAGAEDARMDTLRNDFGNFLDYMQSKKIHQEEDEDEDE